MQNNELTIAFRYQLLDRAGIPDLHREANLQSVELLYQHSKNMNNLKLARRDTRGSQTVVFDVPTKITS